MKTRSFKIIISVILIFVYAINTAAFASQVWSGNYTVDKDPQNPEIEAVKLALGMTAARKTASVSGFLMPEGAYTISFEIYFENHDFSETLSSGYWNIPKIVFSDGESVSFVREQSGVKMKNDSEYLADISFNSDSWNTVEFFFNPEKSEFNLKINERYVSGAEEKTEFSYGAQPLQSVEFFRQSGKAIVMYIKDMNVKAYSAFSLSSEKYLVNTAEGKISGVAPMTTTAEFSNNVTVDGGTLVFWENGNETEKCGILSSGDRAILYNSDKSEKIVYELLFDGFLLDSDLYNIDNENKTVRGVPRGTAKGGFLDGISVYSADSFEVYKSDGAAVRQGEIENGDLFVLKHGSDSISYEIKTLEPTDTVYLNDDFEDNDKSMYKCGSTTGRRVEILPDTDGLYGNSLAFVSDFSENDSPAFIFNMTRSIPNVQKSDVYVWEIDFKYPDYTYFGTNVLGPYLRNSDNRILMNLKRTDKGALVANDGDLQPALSDMITEKWYHAKLIMDVKNKNFDVFLDGRSAAQDFKIQAPSNYIPDHLYLYFTAAFEGTVWLDNIKLYEPNPINISRVSFFKDDAETYNFNNVKADTEEIRLYMGVTDDFEIEESSIEKKISLYDENGGNVPCEIKYESADSLFRIYPKSVLENGKIYTVQASGITDSVYKKEFSDTISFKVKNDDALASAYKKADGSVSVKVCNNTENDDAYTAVCVWYDNTGRILSAGSADTQAEAFLSGTGVITPNIPEGKTADKIKIFVRKQSGGPVCEPIDLK